MRMYKIVNIENLYKVYKNICDLFTLFKIDKYRFRDVVESVLVNVLERTSIIVSSHANCKIQNFIGALRIIVEYSDNEQDFTLCLPVAQNTNDTVLAFSVFIPFILSITDSMFYVLDRLNNIKDKIFEEEKRPSHYLKISHYCVSTSFNHKICEELIKSIQTMYHYYRYNLLRKLYLTLEKDFKVDCKKYIETWEKVFDEQYDFNVIKEYCRPLGFSLDSPYLKVKLEHKKTSLKFSMHRCSYYLKIINMKVKNRCCALLLF